MRELTLLRRNRRFTLGITLAVLVASGIVEAADDLQSAAIQLTDTMHLVDTARSGVEAAVEKAIEAGRTSQKELECIKAADLSAVKNVYADAFSKALTLEELNEANEFLGSSAGQSYLRYSASVELASRGVKSSSTSVELTDKEYAALTKFTETSAGKKLLLGGVLQSRDVQAGVGRVLTPIIQKCRQ